MKKTAVTALILLLVSLFAEAAPKLNLLIITADDMNADSAGWMGSKMGATPALDALAPTCHRFINHHVTSSICQPSRQAIMTGLLPHRSGGLGFNPINLDTPTMVSELKMAGYFTAVLNKTIHMEPAIEFAWDDRLEGSGKDPMLLREHFTKALQHAALNAKPFFVNVNITDPHRPFPGSKEDNINVANPRPPSGPPGHFYKPDEITVPGFLEDIPPVREELAQYFTAVSCMDISLKGVLEALQNSGHADDTVILFLSDNGMALPFSKATVYRTGTWSPVILKWPGMPAASVHEEFVSGVDIMPTLLDILGVAHPVGMDGRSWLPLIKGEKQMDRDYVITHVNTVGKASFPQRCIRTKDSALIFNAWADGSAKYYTEPMFGITYKALEAAGKNDGVTESRVKQLRVGAPLMFFDMQYDSDERRNLVDAPGSAPEIKRLASLLLGQMERTGDPQTENFRRALEHWNGIIRIKKR